MQIAGLESRDDAKLWIIRNQLGRRNLTDFQRVEFALMMKSIIERMATENMAARKGDQAGASSPNSDELKPIRTDDTVAALAGVSRDTVRKVEAIKKSAVPEVIDAVRHGVKSGETPSDLLPLLPKEI